MERSLTAVLEISQVINLSLGLREMLQLLAEEIHSLMGYDCAVVLLDPDTLLLTWAGYYGLSDRYVQAMNAQLNNLRTPEMAQGATGRAYRTRRPAAILDLRDSTVQLWREEAAREGIVTYVATPMTLHDRVLGFVNCYTRQPHTYSTPELELLSIIANQAAIAVEAARLHEHQRERAIELERLNGVLSEQHRLLEQQNAQLLQAERIHDQLTGVILQDSGIAAIVERVSELIGRSVTLYDAELRELARSRADDVADDLQRTFWQAHQVPPALQEHQDVRDEIRHLLGDGQPVRLRWPAEVGARFARYAVPVTTGRAVLACLVAVDTIGELQGLDLRALEHGATAVALELLKQQAVLEAEQQLRGGFLDDLLSGQYDSVEAITRRATYLGFDLTARYRPFAIGLDPSSIGLGDAGAGALHEVGRRVLNIAAASCAARYPKGVVTLRGDTVVVLWPEPEEQRIGAAEAARTLIGEINRSLRGPTVSVGLGSACQQPDGYVGSLEEARYCLELLHRFGNAGRVLAIEELGLHRFLLRSRADAQLLQFAHQRLDPLLEHDRRRNVQLLRTLEIYLATDCSLLKTARQLVMHVNTVQYHLRRVEELTGVRLRSPQGLMEIQLALLVASLSRSEFPELKASVGRAQPAEEEEPNRRGA